MDVRVSESHTHTLEIGLELDLRDMRELALIRPFNNAVMRVNKNDE